MKTKLYITLIISVFLCFTHVSCGKSEQNDTKENQKLTASNQNNNSEDEIESEDEMWNDDDFIRVIKNKKCNYTIKKEQTYYLIFSKAVNDDLDFKNATMKVGKGKNLAQGISISVTNYQADIVPIPIWTVNLAEHQEHILMLQTKNIFVKPVKEISLLAVRLGGMSAEETGCMNEDEFQAKLEALELASTYLYEVPEKYIYVDEPYEKRDDLKSGKVLTVEIEVEISKSDLSFYYIFNIYTSDGNYRYEFSIYGNPSRTEGVATIIGPGERLEGYLSK